MTPKEEKLSKLLSLKRNSAEAELNARTQQCAELQLQIERVIQRRKNWPADPADQLAYEKHIGWLDGRARELSILAAQAEVERATAVDHLRIKFGRETAFAKLVVKNKKAQFRQPFD